MDLGDLRCGGTVIDSYHILTAAHCLHDGDTNILLSKIVGITIAVGNNYPLESHKTDCGKQVTDMLLRGGRLK